MKIYIIPRYLIQSFAIAFTFSSISLIAFMVRSRTTDVNNKRMLQTQVVRKIDISEKLVALTFDDGPGITFTPQVLDLLKLYHANSTFFIVGEQAEKNKSVLIRELKDGHEIGNHMYIHKSVCEISEQELIADLTLSHETVCKIVQSELKLYRPTTGYFNKTIFRVAGALNYTIVLWNIDSRDWTGLDGRLIAQKIIETVKPGSIILFHDFGGNRSNTITALKILLPQLTQQGYSFVTVSTLLKKAKK